MIEEVYSLIRVMVTLEVLAEEERKYYLLVELKIMLMVVWDETRQGVHILVNMMVVVMEDKN